MRIRSIKPEFWSDEKLARARRALRLTFVGLWSCSDDHGVTRGNPAWIRSQLYPYDVDTTIQEMQAELDELEALGFITGFTRNCEKFYFIHNFAKHQRIDRRSAPLHPQPTPDELSTRALGTLDEGSRGLIVGAGSREQVTGSREGECEGPAGKKKPAARAKGLPADFVLTEELVQYAIEAGVQPGNVAREYDKFRDHFLANGKAMKDWGAAWRNWARRSTEYSRPSQRSTSLDKMASTVEVFARRHHARQNGAAGGSRTDSLDAGCLFPEEADRPGDRDIPQGARGALDT